MDLTHTHTALFHQDYSCNLGLAFIHDYFKFLRLFSLEIFHCKLIALLKGAAELVWDEAQVGHGHFYIYLNFGLDLPLCLCVELLTVDISGPIHSGPRVVW